MVAAFRVKPAAALAVVACSVLVAQQPCTAAATSEPKRIRGHHQELAAESPNSTKQVRSTSHGAVRQHAKLDVDVGKGLNASKPNVADSVVQEKNATIAPILALGSNDAMFGHIADVALEAVPVRMLARLGSFGKAQQVAQSAETAVDPAAPAKFTFAGFIVQALFVFLFAFIYQSKKAGIMEFIALRQTPHDKLLLEREDFAFGLFTCCDEPKLCLLSCCCGAVRWADTVRMMGFFVTLMGAVATYLCVYLVGNLLLPGGFWLLLILQVYYRQKMRAEFNMPNGTCMTCFEDCLAYCCCSPCAITQEARQAELAARVGYPSVVP